ncbi:MAG: VOC family protein [Alphaproteobacteria bacterium]|jgi:catechol 2,3-dioxygenase-like lactoylglutathione lyase family enzyme|nr:VOC family protein [Alphaproteobacteria bacterium]
MLDHVSIGTSDFARARAFYDAVLATLGYAPVMVLEQYEVAGYGQGQKPSFWVHGPAGCPMPGHSVIGSGPGQHVAFTAPDRHAVDAFHAAGTGLGAKDNGAPGLRPHYHPAYYGAFLVDPDGHRIEACCHHPE